MLEVKGSWLEELSVVVSGVEAWIEEGGLSSWILAGEHSQSTFSSAWNLLLSRRVSDVSGLRKRLAQPLPLLNQAHGYELQAVEPSLEDGPHVVAQNQCINRDETQGRVASLYKAAAQTGASVATTEGSQ